jgi:hypothetical protein
MKIVLFGGLRPFNLKAALRDVVAGVTLASMNIPQVLGYARIAGMPVVTGLYTVLLPILAFAVFGSSRHLVVAADSATAVIFSGSLTSMAAPASEKYVALVGMVALLTAGILLLAWVFKLGFLADFLAHTATGRLSHRCRVSGRYSDAGRYAWGRGPLAQDARSGVGDLPGSTSSQCRDRGRVGKRRWRKVSPARS